jgi:aspartate aminotransferase
MSLPLSDRAAAMPASPIRKLAPYADAAKAAGVTVYHLNIGQPDLPSPDQFWDAVQNTGLSTLEYSPSNGLTPMREGAASYYQSIGIDVTADQIIVTTAGSEALCFAIMTCLNPGDEVIVPEPLYANYIGFATQCDVKVVPLTTRIEDDFALPSTEEFAAKIGPRTKAIIICNPSNPTGTVYDRAQLEQLRDLAVQHNLFIIADEVYRDFNYTGRPITSVLQLSGLDDRAVMIDSVSKRYSLCGARVGFLVSRNKEFLAQALKFAQARLSPPTLEQYGVIGALETPQSYFEEVRTEYMKRRDLLVSRLRAMPGVVVPQINGAFYATVRLPIDDSDRFCQWLLESFRFENQTVMFAPATGFYETPGQGRDEVRIAYVLNCDRLNRAMDVLEAALKAYAAVPA